MTIKACYAGGRIGVFDVDVQRASVESIPEDVGQDRFSPQEG